MCALSMMRWAQVDDARSTEKFQDHECSPLPERIVASLIIIIQTGSPMDTWC